MRRRAALAFIFVTVLLDMLAIGLIAPVLAPLVVSFLGGDTARAAEIYGLAFTLFAAMQFVASPVLGALSDRFGRRPIILLSNLGLGLDYVLMALAPNVGWLLLWGLACGAAGFATYGLAPTGSLFCIGIALLSLWGLSRAARHVTATEQGRLQGLDGSLRAIADLIGPGLFTLTFAHFIAPGSDMPGAPFLLAALLQVAAIAPRVAGDAATAGYTRPVSIRMTRISKMSPSPPLG